MSRILDALSRIPDHSWHQVWHHPAWKEYLVTGEPARLKALPRSMVHRYLGLPSELREVLSEPESFGEHEVRFLKAWRAVQAEDEALRSWLGLVFDKEPISESRWACVLDLARSAGWKEKTLADAMVTRVEVFLSADRSVTPAGKYLLGLADDELLRLLVEHGYRPPFAASMVSLLLGQDQGRCRKIFAELSRKPEAIRCDPDAWVLGIQEAPEMFIELSAEVYRRGGDWDHTFAIGRVLCRHQPERFAERQTELARERLLAIDTNGRRTLWNQSRDAGVWLAEHHGVAAVPDLVPFFAAALDTDDWTRKHQVEHKVEVLNQAFARMGGEVLPLVDACFATDQADVQIHALTQVAALGWEVDPERRLGYWRTLLKSRENNGVTRAVRVSATLAPESLEPDLWELLSHKSRPVREAAARALARFGESRLAKAESLWAARRADTRLAAVVWLEALGTPGAAACLRARLEVETDEDVRDALLLALERFPGGHLLEPEVVERRIRATLAASQAMPVPWLSAEQLPAGRQTDGTRLSADLLRYLLLRQSRVKTMRADLEARPVYQRLDRHGCSDLAMAVFQAFVASGASAEHRWAMAFAACVGDDRLVPLVCRQIREWADSQRGKLAEYAVQALALLGSDVALLAVDAMTIRYRSKNRNVGKAAAEAFAAAAEARGMTLEELGDRVVPTFQFPATGPRRIEAGKTVVEARITDDFKLVFRDAGTGRKLAKLPESASAEVRAEFKETAAALKEAVKSQCLRLENLMVRQFRWTWKRWQELYLGHPLLLPFAHRLVWGAYDSHGVLVQTFRVLDDGTLTDNDDNAVTPGDEGGVGMVHPLEISADQRAAWVRHLADYDIAPPFPQLERPVLRCTAEQAGVRLGKTVEGTELNGLTFKGRAERFGWTRGSVCDAGGISHYLKRFTTSGVDAFVATDGMYIGIDMDTSIKLGCVFFVKTGTVSTAPYEYDEPGDPSDGRLIPWGEVPVIAFSEAMGELMRIAGKTAGMDEASSTPPSAP